MTTTTMLLRPCMWGLAFAGLLMTTTPAAAELPISVMYDQTEAAGAASPQTTERLSDQVRVEMPRQHAERAADAQIHHP